MSGASSFAGCHLVGSAPLASSDAVFRKVAGAPGRHLQRLPDGEVGRRTTSISWQDAYFAPFRQLRLAPEAGLFVSLLHDQDGGQSSASRLAAASKVLPRFGIATECGFGRRPEATIGPLLAIHAAVATPVATDPAASEL